ncbi:GatB/YqeY domain-containing protein [Candidatus Berkelbacteria bacterium]|nr:GatB/YqeY domain-containing protein [Candidatus Berkelbacteria bacterium]MBI4029573.1 GatB/YqeY domain-containing protein [Candidatus Berkelbacteria bacterium]
MTFLTLFERIQNDFNQARLQREEKKATVLSFLLSQIHNKEIEKREKLQDSEIINLIKTEIKQRNESKEAFLKAKREEEVRANQAAVLILQNYLPKSLSEEEIKNEAIKTVSKVGAKGEEDFGQVMNVLMPKLAGKAEGNLVSQIVKEILSQRN